MTDNVIFLADLAAKKSAPENRWRFSLDVFDGSEGLITSFDDQDGLEAGDRLRQFAGCLEGLAFLMRQQAELISASEDGAVLAQAFIHKSSRVRVRVNDSEIVTEEQRQWLVERWGDASQIARDGAPCE